MNKSTKNEDQNQKVAKHTIIVFQLYQHPTNILASVSLPYNFWESMKFLFDIYI